MNFNFNSSPEYNLNSSMAKEMINLYGINLKLLVTEKINPDVTVFGDFSHLKSNSDSIFDLMALPEDSEGWDSSDFGFSMFGPANFENISLFIHLDSIKDILSIKELTSNLLVFPNNKLMEITHTEPVVPGINNLFTFDDAKTIIKISCKPYSQKLISELDPEDRMYSIEDPDLPDSGDFESLEKYFDEIMERTDDLEEETEVIPSVDTIERDEVQDKVIKKPIVDNSIDDVWGKF